MPVDFQKYVLSREDILPGSNTDPGDPASDLATRPLPGGNIGSSPVETNSPPARDNPEPSFDPPPRTRAIQCSRPPRICAAPESASFPPVPWSLFCRSCL